jgi:MFS family permease
MTEPLDPHMEMTPFSRLAVVQAVSVAGDTCLNVALAGSIFFALDPSQARPRVLLFLVCTFLPFVLLSPLIGPALDRSRGGRRLVVAACALGRAILLFTLAFYISSKGLTGYLLYPLAFGALMFSKGYNVAKSSLVPAVVRGQQTFVKANSRLAIISVIAGAVAVVPAGATYLLTGASGVLRLGAAIFVVCTLLAFRIPKAPVVAPPLSEEAKAELHARSIVLSGTLMALIRGTVGFLTLLILFWVKTTGQSVVMYGIAGAAAAVGNVGGVVLAPALRKHLREETILAGAAIIAGAIALITARAGNFVSLSVMAFVIAVAAAAGRLAFDSLVQRDAPDAARGRVFARYETRFQAVWVLGALIPVTITLSNQLGLFVIAVVALGAGITYVVGLRNLRNQPPPAVGADADDEQFLGLQTPEGPHIDELMVWPTSNEPAEPPVDVDAPTDPLA